MENEDFSDDQTWCNTDITETEVKFVLNNTRLRKAVGIDNIPYVVLKNSISVPLLRCLFSKIFHSHVIQAVWCQAILKLIPKNYTIDPRLLLQYREIALLSTGYKVYASVLNNRIVKYLEENNIYAEDQNGFRQNRSCSDHVCTLASILRNRKLMGKSTFVAYLDAEKAFDRIDCDLLLYKLLQNGIYGHLYENVKTIYSESTCSVKVNERLTDWLITKSGVKQGDTLTPTLFGIFINDIVHEVNNLILGINIGNRKLSILLYGDDIVLLLSDAEEGLQTMLNTVYA